MRLRRDRRRRSGSGPPSAQSGQPAGSQFILMVVETPADVIAVGFGIRPAVGAVGQVGRIMVQSDAKSARPDAWSWSRRATACRPPNAGRLRPGRSNGSSVRRPRSCRHSAAPSASGSRRPPAPSVPPARSQPSQTADELPAWHGRRHLSGRDHRRRRRSRRPRPQLS